MNIPKFGQYIGIIYGQDKEWGLNVLREIWPKYKMLPIIRYTKQLIEFGDGTIICLLSGTPSELKGRRFDVAFVGATISKEIIEDDLVYCTPKLFIQDSHNGFISHALWLREQTFYD